MGRPDFLDGGEGDAVAHAKPVSEFDQRIAWQRSRRRMTAFSDGVVRLLLAVSGQYDRRRGKPRTPKASRSKRTSSPRRGAPIAWQVVSRIRVLTKIACPVAPPHSSALARSTGKCVRAHDLHTPLCKQLILSVNPTDPSSGRYRIDVTSHSFTGVF